VGGSWISPLSSIAATAHSRLACASTSTWSCAWLGAWPRRPTSRTSRRRRCSRPGATATRSTRAGRRCGPGCWRSSYGSPARPGPGPCGRHRAPCRLNPGACPSGPGSAETLPSGGSPRVAACGAGPTRDVRGRTTPGASHSPWSRFAVSPSSVEGTPASRAAAQGDHGRCALPAGHAHAGVDGDDASEEGPGTQRESEPGASGHPPRPRATGAADVHPEAPATRHPSLPLALSGGLPFLRRAQPRVETNPSEDLSRPSARTPPDARCAAMSGRFRVANGRYSKNVCHGPLDRP